MDYVKILLDKHNKEAILPPTNHTLPTYYTTLTYPSKYLPTYQTKLPTLLHAYPPTTCLTTHLLTDQPTYTYPPTLPNTYPRLTLPTHLPAYSLAYLNTYPHTLSTYLLTYLLTNLPTYLPTHLSYYPPSH